MVNPVWLSNNSDNAWRRLGKTEPYSAVIAHDSAHDFFESGELHISSVLEIVRQQLDPQHNPVRALDFGCGVARLVIPLARRYDEVVGIDVSQDMLAEARRNCDERNIRNVTFLSETGALARDGIQFDLVHTHIVLQHIPPSRGVTIFSQLIDLISPGGIGALHVQYWRDASTLRKFVHRMRRDLPLTHNLANLVQGLPLRQPLMQMNVYSVRDLLLLLQKKACHNVVLRFTETPTGGYVGLMILFRKEARMDFD